MGSLGAHCQNFLTSAHRDIPRAQWDDMRYGQICTNDPEGHKGETFAEWKAAIEKLCSSTGLCDEQTKAEIRQSLSRLEGMQR